MTSKLFLYVLFILSVVIVVAMMSGCLNTEPSCLDNPRRMSCMSPEQLQKELNK